jgi:hypothetical protein
LVDHSEDLVRLDQLIGLHEHLLNPASQLALHHNVLSGRANNASGAHGFLNGPKTRGQNKKACSDEHPATNRMGPAPRGWKKLVRGSVDQVMVGRGGDGVLH